MQMTHQQMSRLTLDQVRHHTFMLQFHDIFKYYFKNFVKLQFQSYLLILTMQLQSFFVKLISIFVLFSMFI